MRTLLVIKKHTINVKRYIRVEIYSTTSCPHCVSARSLLNKKGIHYIEHRIDEDDKLRVEMISRSKRSSVPQIFVNDNFIGDYDDLVQFDNNSEFEKLIGLTPDDSTANEKDQQVRRRTIITGL